MDFLKTNNHKLQRIALIAVAVLTLLALVLLLVIIMASVDKGLGDRELNDVIESLEFESKEIAADQLVTGSLVLVDSAHPYTVGAEKLGLLDLKAYRNNMLTEDGIDHTIPENLPYQPYSNMQFDKNAIASAHKMLSDAVKAVDGGSITVDGAFGRQENKSHIGASDISEFNTGLLLFLADKTSDGTQQKYVPLSEDYAKWLDKNAAKYGFVKSFNGGYRYVGVAHAKYMTDEKLSLAEYIEYLKKETSRKDIKTIKGADGTSYGVYYVECAAGESVKLPVATDDISYEISGTNEGGIIVTIKLN